MPTSVSPCSGAVSVPRLAAGPPSALRGGGVGAAGPHGARATAADRARMPRGGGVLRPAARGRGVPQQSGLALPAQDQELCRVRRAPGLGKGELVQVDGINTRVERASSLAA